jgi:murein L,D-transpeptidase YcbB/YkuD
MNADQTASVTVQNPIPIWIVYGTAVVHEDGQVYFLNDIYGYDAALERALEVRGKELVTPSK